MLEVEDTFVEMARGYFIKPLAVFVSGKCFIEECWVAFSEAPGVSRFLEFCTIACSTKKRADLKLELFSKVGLRLPVIFRAPFLVSDLACLVCTVQIKVVSLLMNRFTGPGTLPVALVV